MVLFYLVVGMRKPSQFVSLGEKATIISISFEALIMSETSFGLRMYYSRACEKGPCHAK